MKDDFVFQVDRKSLIDDEFYDLLQRSLKASFFYEEFCDRLENEKMDLRAKMLPEDNELLQRKRAIESGYIVVEAVTVSALENIVNMWSVNHNFRPLGGICFAHGTFHQTMVKRESHFSVEVEQKASDVPPSRKKKKKS